jgi:hypothetical protein
MDRTGEEIFNGYIQDRCATRVAVSRVSIEQPVEAPSNPACINCCSSNHGLIRISGPRQATDWPGQKVTFVPQTLF